MIKVIAALLVALTSLWAQQHKEHSCIDRYFTLSISASHGVTIKDLVDNLASECKISVVFEDGGVEQQLERSIGYLNADNYSLNELFELVFEENNIYYEFDSQRELLRLAHIKTKTFYIDYVNFASRTSESTKTINMGANSGEPGGAGGDGISGNSDVMTIASTSDFAFWRTIENEVQRIIVQDSFEAQDQVRTILNKDAGTLTVSATSRQLERVQNYLDKIMARLHKQIMIEAKIVEVTNSDVQNRGIDWNQLFSAGATLRGGYNRNTDLGNGDDKYAAGDYGSFLGYDYGLSVSRIMEFLDTNGDVEVVSNPKILTLNNQPAIINVGEQLFYRYQSGDVIGNDRSTIEYTTESIFVGISLSVTPEVTEDGFVMLTVQPVISSVKRDATTTDSSERVLPPDIGIKQMSSMVKVKEGSKIVIGGLMENEAANESVGIPLLRNIPLFGRLFGKESTRDITKELVVILTPKFIDGETKPTIENFNALFVEENLDQNSSADQNSSVDILEKE
ncbi:MAG: pilus (MSHA type) biogenesis protein MshL [Campylobacterota bacterium]